MKYLHLLAIGFVLLFSTCYAQQNEGRPAVWTDDPTVISYEANKVLFKIIDEMAHIDMTYDSANGFLSEPLPEFRDLVESQEIVLIKRLFPVKNAGMIDPKKPDLQLPHDLSTCYEVVYRKETDAKELSEIISAIPFIEFAEPDYHCQMSVVPNDPGRTNQNYLQDVDAFSAWDLSTGDASQIIGIVDTGVDWDHVDLSGNIWSNSAEVNGEEGVDDDGNGYVDDIRGWDFVNDDANPNDDNSHGTHVAGIAAARTNNNIGMAGIAWNARIMPVKVLQSSGRGSWSDVAQGLAYCADNGATVINMSLGGYSESLTLKTALENAYYSSFPVAAAGNDFIGIHVADCGPRLPWPTPHFPACYSFVMGVQSSTGRFSNYDCSGPTRALNADGFNYEVSFPGSSIYSTLPNNRYGNFTGTSMASPIVAGAAALLKSYRTNITHEEMFTRLIACNGDIEYALSMSLAPNLVLFGFTVVDTLEGCDRDGVADAGETILLNVTTKNFGGFAENITANLSLGEYEDPTVADITDGYSEMGNASSYARVNTDDNPFVIEIDENTANNRDIVLEVQFDCENSDQSFTYEVVITVQRGEELRGLREGVTHLLADRYYIVTDNVVCDTMIIDPGTTIRVSDEKKIGVFKEYVSNGTPDSLITYQANDNENYWKGIQKMGNYSSMELNLDYCDLNDIDFNKTYQYNYNTIKNTLISGTPYNVYEIAEIFINKCIFTLNNVRWYNFLYSSSTLLNSLIINNNHSANSPERMAIISGYYSPSVFNNAIFNNFYQENPTASITLLNNRDAITHAQQNYYGTADSAKIEWQVYDYFEYSTLEIVTGRNALKEPPINAHGHVRKIEIEDIDAQDEYDLLDPMGSNDTKRFDVYFNRAMDTREQPFLSFGVREPYTQRLVSDSARWISWKRDESVGETIYQLQISEDSTFATTVIDIDTIKAVNYYVSELDSTFNYFWRVRYKNDGDDWQKWSDVYNFRTHINSVPDAPELVSPPDGSQDEYTKIMLRWEKSNFADSVHIQVSTSETFNTTILNAFKLNMFVDCYEVSNLDLSTEYFWRVRFHNQEGWGDFSDIWSFTTYTDSVKAPTLVYPVDGQDSISASCSYPKFEWENVITSSEYQIQVADDSEFNSINGNEPRVENTYHWWRCFPVSDTLFWRVRTIYEGNVSSKWSEIRKFYTIDHTNSVTPELVSPEDKDNVSIENGNPVLKWNSVNQRYGHLQIATDNSFSNLIHDDSGYSYSTEITFYSYEIGTTYYWRVRTQADGQPWSDWSEVRSFTIITDNEEPKPLLCVPSDNARGQKTDSLWLKWNNAPGANTVYDARWQAYYTFDYRTPQGLQTLRVANAYDNEYFEAPIEDWRFGFEVQTTSGASSNFTAEGGVERIDLEWDIPEDNNYIGFNIYRFVQTGEEEFGDTVQVNQQLILDSTFTDFSVLPDSTYYYVYRVLQTNLQESDDSKIASAMAIGSTLLPPNLLFPPEDSTNMATTITLDWDEPSGAEEYVLQIATDQYYTDIILDVEGILSSNYTVQGLTNNQWYYWRVKAEGVQGTSLWSNIWAFHTKPRLPLQPTLVYPSDNANQIPTSVNLDWNEAQYATHYQLQVSFNNYFNNLIYDNDEITNTIQGISGLQQNMEYFWRSSRSECFRLWRLVGCPFLFYRYSRLLSAASKLGFHR
jgi:subtilisin family serine protease